MNVGGPKGQMYGKVANVLEVTLRLVGSLLLWKASSPLAEMIAEQINKGHNGGALL